MTEQKETTKPTKPLTLSTTARTSATVSKGGETQGGSTITQQYVKNNRLADQSQTLSRKVKELFISIRVGGELA